MPEYKLTYFNGMGLAESIRLLLTYMDQPFTDNRIQMEEWAGMKKNTPWGKMPMLEVDGKVVCQSTAICRYLGKIANLAGKDNWEALQIDMLADCATDLRLEFSAYFREQDAAKKEKMMSTMLNESIPFYFSKFDKQIKENKGFLVNGKLSWADIVICSFLQMFNTMIKKDLTESYPNVKGLLNTFVNHPKLKTYIANRPVTPF